LDLKLIYLENQIERKNEFVEKYGSRKAKTTDRQRLSRFQKIDKMIYLTPAGKVTN
jgi:hypothetical protein